MINKNSIILSQLLFFLLSSYCIFYIFYLLAMNHTAFELLSSPKEIAFISVDNTQGFENQALQELYVSEGEQAAQGSKAVVDLCKGYGISLINVFDSHPRGHLLFSQNYKDKKPFEMISYEEVKAWTPQEHGLSQRAGFGLSELQSHLQKVGQEMLWPDHCIQGTQGAQLMPPLEESDFDFHLPKGTAPVSSGYSGFEQTVLDNILKEQGKKVLLL